VIARLPLLAALAAAALGAVGCQPVMKEPEVAAPVMRLRWRLVTSDRSKELGPQEFASAAA